MPRPLTVREVALQLGLSERRVVALLHAGRIPGARLIGRMWFIPRPLTITPGSRGPKMKGFAA